MGIYDITAEMGKGKTLFCILFMLQYLKENPLANVIANFHIFSIKNFTYSPYFVLPISQIHDTLLICDDFYALKSCDSLISAIVNMSRKRKISVLLTAQYYTMVKPIMRNLSIETHIQYFEDSDILIASYTTPEGRTSFEYHEKCVEIAKNYYDTNEVVEFATEKGIIDSIIELCNTKKELDYNCEIFFKNQSVRKSILKKLYAVKGFS